jgi:hypothetical protein
MTPGDRQSFLRWRTGGHLGARLRLYVDGHLVRDDPRASSTGLATPVASIVAGGLWDIAGPRGTFLAGVVFTALALLALPAVRVGRRVRASGT